MNKRSHWCVALLPSLLAGFTVAGPALVPGRTSGGVENTYTRYVLLTNTHLLPSGTAIWFGSGSYLDGRVHTNGELRFSGNPSFEDTVSSVGNRAWFYNKGNPKELADDHNGVIDVPIFQRGFERAVEPVAFPSDAYPQQNAALGLAPDENPPSNQMIRSQLALGEDVTPPPNGIYMVHAGGAVMGGLYVQGNLDQLTATADTSNGRQILRFAQGATVKIITVDPAAGTTSVTVGASTTVYTGLPRGVLYVAGQIADLRGPDRVGGAVLPALLDGQRWLLVSTGDIVIQRDVVAQRFDAGDAVLGLFSSGGSVRIGSAAPNDLRLDAFVMAVGESGDFEVDNYSSGSARGTLHLRGGCVSRYFGAFTTYDASGAVHTGYARDFRHDDRGWVPPYFPDLPSPVASAPSPSPRPIPGFRITRVQPNPARGDVHIHYVLDRPRRVRLSVLDSMGRRVAILLDSERTAEAREVSWPRRSSESRMAPGWYLVVLESEGARMATRVLCLD